MRDVLLVIHLILAASLVVLVLLQRSEGKLGAGLGGGGGGGAGGGMGDFMTPRGTANFLTRATSICGGLFFLTSLLLALLMGQEADFSLSEELQKQVPAADAPAESQPKTPEVPISE